MRTRRTRLGTPIALLLLAGLLLSASTAPAAPATQFPPGTYVTTITPADLPPGAPPFLAGEWAVEFGADGTYSVTLNGQLLVWGRYVGNPARIVMDGGDGPLACGHPATATAVYAWELEGDELTLAPIRDFCGGRAFVLTTHPLTRQ